MMSLLAYFNKEAKTDEKATAIKLPDFAIFFLCKLLALFCYNSEYRKNFTAEEIAVLNDLHYRFVALEQTNRLKTIFTEDELQKHYKKLYDFYKDSPLYQMNE